MFKIKHGEFLLLLALPAILSLPAAAQQVQPDSKIQLAQAAGAANSAANSAEDKKKKAAQKKNNNKSADKPNKKADKNNGPNADAKAERKAQKQLDKAQNKAKANNPLINAPANVQKNDAPQVKPVDRKNPNVNKNAKNNDKNNKRDKQDAQTKQDKQDKQATPNVGANPGAGALGLGNAKPSNDRSLTSKNDNDAKKKSAASKRPDKAVAKTTFVAPPKTVKKFEQVKKERKEKTSADGKTRVIVENDKRVIIKQDNRVIIRNDDSDRFRRVARGAKTTRRNDGFSETVYLRSDGVRVYNVVDRDGRLVHRYRRDRFGRDVVLIDNRRSYRGDGNRDLAIGLGIGVVVGAALVALAPPTINIPREKYIVDYGRASDDDLYEAMTAPPIERLDRSYSLDEIRYSAPLRERMRRIDVDTVTFDFGSWDVTPEQYSALERIANVINRALDANADEIFLIEGYTDAVGSEDDNLTLSDRRAQAVAEILTSNFGVPPENLVTQGYGEEQLKIDTQEPERENRRIAFRRVTPLMADQSESQSQQ